MRNLNFAPITKEIIREIDDNCTFIDNVNFEKYDRIVIEDDYIEIVKFPKYIINEKLQYIKISDGYVGKFKKDNLSGIFIECY